MPTLSSGPSGDGASRPTPIPCDPAFVAFLDRFDHDLRTPLGTMAAAVELLRDDPADPALHAASIAVLERQIARMHALTLELREFARRCEGRGGDARGA
jgi:signal transduction histidine kinase